MRKKRREIHNRRVNPDEVICERYERLVNALYSYLDSTSTLQLVPTSSSPCSCAIPFLYIFHSYQFFTNWELVFFVTVVFVRFIYLFHSFVEIKSLEFSALWTNRLKLYVQKSFIFLALSFSYSCFCVSLFHRFQ